VGHSLTLADIALYAYTHVAHEGGFDLSSYPAIRAWLDRVAAEPGHVPIDA
jgi:glutathione S-transferase